MPLVGRGAGFWLDAEGGTWQGAVSANWLGGEPAAFAAGWTPLLNWLDAERAGLVNSGFIRTALTHRCTSFKQVSICVLGCKSCKWPFQILRRWPNSFMNACKQNGHR